MTQKKSGRKPLSATVLLVAFICTFLVGHSSCYRNTASQPAVIVTTISPHLPFGNPSDAGNDPDNRLVLRSQFASSWCAKKRIANWVAWRLVATDIGDTERSQFYTDAEVATPPPKDYTGSGYDRGHLCPSKDRSDTPENNRAIFTMLNIIPQTPDNNRGPWEKAERFERSLAQAGREVYVIAGSVGSQTSFKGITVPESTWKVVVALEQDRSFPEGQEKAQVFAVMIPNSGGIKEDRWQQYQTTVAKIEQQTGYRFFKGSPIIENIARKVR